MSRCTIDYGSEIVDCVDDHVKRIAKDGKCNHEVVHRRLERNFENSARLKLSGLLPIPCRCEPCDGLASKGQQRSQLYFDGGGDSIDYGAIDDDLFCSKGQKKRKEACSSGAATAPKAKRERRNATATNVIVTENADHGGGEDHGEGEDHMQTARARPEEVVLKADGKKKRKEACSSGAATAPRAKRERRTATATNVIVTENADHGGGEDDGERSQSCRMIDGLIRCALVRTRPEAVAAAAGAPVDAAPQAATTITNTAVPTSVIRGGGTTGIVGYQHEHQPPIIAHAPVANGTHYFHEQIPTPGAISELRDSTLTFFNPLAHIPLPSAREDHYHIGGDVEESEPEIRREDNYGNATASVHAACASASDSADVNAAAEADVNAAAEADGGAAAEADGGAAAEADVNAAAEADVNAAAEADGGAAAEADVNAAAEADGGAAAEADVNAAAEADVNDSAEADGGAAGDAVEANNDDGTFSNPIIISDDIDTAPPPAVAAAAAAQFQLADQLNVQTSSSFYNFFLSLIAWLLLLFSPSSKVNHYHQHDFLHTFLFCTAMTVLLFWEQQSRKPSQRYDGGAGGSE
jgi:hypothetical protein